MAADLHISNLAALPDLRVFKQTLKVPTVNNRLGVGEKQRVTKMMKEIYQMDESFTREIDQSIRRRCKGAQDVQKIHPRRLWCRPGEVCRCRRQGMGYPWNLVSA